MNRKPGHCADEPFIRSWNNVRENRGAEKEVSKFKRSMDAAAVLNIAQSGHPSYRVCCYSEVHEQRSKAHTAEVKEAGLKL